MNLIKYPFDNFLSLERAFNNLLRTSVQETDWFSKDKWLPQTDVIETDNEIKVQLDCPGISPQDLKVTLENNVLTVKGEKKNETEEKNGSYHKLERSFGTFTRSFALPTSVEQDSVSAEYKNGVVSIVAMKSEQSKARTIEIKTTEESKPKALSASASSG